MKNILLTGATSGIGEATARCLAEQGYYVICVGRNEVKLRQLCQEYKEHISSFHFDLSNLDRIHEIFDWCRNQGVKLDGMAYCAGVCGEHMPVRGIRWEHIQNEFTVNCMAFIQMSKYMISRKYSNDGSSIVAISSLASHTAYAGTTAYSVSKGALNAACKVLAKEAMPRKIRVNALMPGYVDTPMNREFPIERVQQEQPFGYIDAIEIAYLIEFLLSDKSKKITGAEIPISAGMQF